MTRIILATIVIAPSLALAQEAGDPWHPPHHLEIECEGPFTGYIATSEAAWDPYNGLPAGLPRPLRPPHMRNATHPEDDAIHIHSALSKDEIRQMGQEAFNRAFQYCAEATTIGFVQPAKGVAIAYARDGTVIAKSKRLDFARLRASAFARFRAEAKK